MARTKETTDHEEIRRWAEKHGARPSQVVGRGGLLRFDFGDAEERLEEIGWDRFFEAFDAGDVALIFDPNGRFNKFVGEEDVQSHGSRRSGIGTRRKRTAARTPARGTGGRKKPSSTARKRKTTTRKASTRKTTGRKKATARKRQTGGRKSR